MCMKVEFVCYDPRRNQMLPEILKTKIEQVCVGLERDSGFHTEKYHEPKNFIRFS